MSIVNTDQIEVFNLNAEKVGVEKIPDYLKFDAFHSTLVWEAIVAYRAALRQGTHSTKTRGEVRGGGAKPWRQKGTGRARAGSNRSPIWKGGGVVFGPTPRNYRYAFPKRKKSLALRHALFQKLNENRFLLLDRYEFSEINTKKAFLSFTKLVEKAPFSKEYFGNKKIRSNSNEHRCKVLLVIADNDINNLLSVRNIPWLEMIHVDQLFILPTFYSFACIMTKVAFEKLKIRFAK